MTQPQVKVWDWPVRLTHWAFAVLLPAMWWTAENGEMGWHMRLGLVLLGLVVFRILWGLFGSETARFASFLKGPGAVIDYLKDRAGWHARAIGHSPVGGWSTLVLLLAILAQTSFGLFSGDPFDGATGPLNETVGVMTADRLTEWHEQFFWIVVGLVGFHLVAVAFYQFFDRKNLVGPMVTGKRADNATLSPMVEVPAWRAFICVIIAFGLVSAIWTGALERWLS